jgi:Tol biopolymer transport system component
MRKAVDGSGQETTILETSEPVHVSDVSRDGTMLLLEERSGTIPTTTWILPLAAGSKPRLLSDDPVGTHFARFSPDGKWVSYVTTETGRNEIYLTSLAAGGKQQLTSGGGWQSRWAADGKALYYNNGEGATVSLPLIRTGDAIAPGKARQLFSTSTLLPTSFYSSSWDVTPDGRHFLVNVSGERSDESRAVLITNWPARLKK